MAWFSVAVAVFHHYSSDLRRYGLPGKIGLRKF